MNNEERILVAIQCAVYNHEPYLRDCLDGFVQQKTNFRFVAIVHDDVSTDKSADIIREYAEKYPDIIKPKFETENQWSKRDGSIERILQKMLLATGAKYIAFCEGDDYWIDSLKLQKQVDFMETHPNVGLCGTDFNVLNEVGNQLQEAMFRNGMYKPSTFEEHLMNSGYIAPMTWMYRSDILKTMDFQDSHTDGTFAFALDFFHKSKIAFLDDVTAVYRVHSNSAANPSDIQKKWAYSKGVIATQIAMAKKYGCSNELIDKIKFQGYVTEMLLAEEAEDDAFVQEATDFFFERGYMMKWFVESCKEYVRYKKQYNQICSSKAYRIGKALLKPFKWRRKNSAHN